MEDSGKYGRERRWPGVGLIAAITLWAAWPEFAPGPPMAFAPPAPVSIGEGGAAPRLTSAVINAVEPPLVHAASIASLPDGRLFAVWFGGAREGASDVNVYAAYRAPGELAWGPQQSIASPQQTSRDTGLFTRKLGNPVAFVTPQGELWVIYVSVAVGGWATSQLNLLRSADWGAHWQPATRLTVSPFFNVSTLVKGGPVFFANGDIGVPAYHELGSKFAELLVLSPGGRVERKIRMDAGRRTLQPVILVQDASRAVALMRDGTEEVFKAWRSQTDDGGRHWSQPEATGLDNPNSALAAVRLADGRLIAVANDTVDGRLRLSLMASADEGRHWRVLHRFEDRQDTAGAGQTLAAAGFRARLGADLGELGPHPAPAAMLAKVERNQCRQSACGWQYDYPYLIAGAGGDFHLVYTWNKSFIRHVSFNRAWLEERL